MVGATSIRISWGRSSANRQTPSLGVVAPPPPFPQMGNGGYGYPTTYGDPNAAYATAPYGAAPNDPYAGSLSVRSMMQAWLTRSKIDIPTSTIRALCTSVDVQEPSSGCQTQATLLPL